MASDDDRARAQTFAFEELPLDLFAVVLEILAEGNRGGMPAITSLRATSTTLRDMCDAVFVLWTTRWEAQLVANAHWHAVVQRMSSIGLHPLLDGRHQWYRTLRELVITRHMHVISLDTKRARTYVCTCAFEHNGDCVKHSNNITQIRLGSKHVPGLHSLAEGTIAFWVFPKFRSLCWTYSNDI